MQARKSEEITEAEGAAIAELVGVAQDILKKVLKDGHPVTSIEMDNHQKQRLMDGYTGVMNMLLAHRRSAMKKLGVNNSWMAIVNNPKHQELMRDEKGVPLTAPVERPVAPVEEQRKEFEKSLTIMERIASGEWSNPSGQAVIEALGEKDQAEDNDHEQPDLFDEDDQADDQAETQTVTETYENGVTATFKLIPGVPRNIQAALITACRDRSTKGKAVKDVSREAGLDEFTVAGYFETLLEAGLLEKDGKSHYIAHLPNELPPAEASIG